MVSVASAFASLSKLFPVQVTIMEEAGQDVPSWLRGEADRFTKHEVQGSFEGVFVSSYVCPHLPHRL